MKSNEPCLFQVFVLAFEAYPKYKSIAAFTFTLYLYCLVRIVDQLTILSGMTELIRRTKLILLIT